MIYKRASEIVPRPFDEVKNLFFSHPVDDDYGCEELLEELLTYFQPDEPAPPPSIWHQCVGLLIDHGLCHPSPFVRGISADVLGRAAPTYAIEPLLRLLSDEDEYVRVIVREAIGPRLTGEAFTTLYGDGWIEGTIPGTGFELDDVYDLLLEGMRHENRWHRVHSSAILARNYRCAKAIPRMLEVLYRDNDLWVRYHIAVELGVFAQDGLDDVLHNRIISALQSAHHHESPIVRWGAARGLFQYAELTSVEATNFGVDLLSINHDQLTLSILWWCKNCGSQEAVQPIHDFIYQHNPTLIDEEVLTDSCVALEALGAIDELINLLRATNRPSFNLAAAYELRFMEQLNQHEDRVAVAENVVQCLQNDDNFDDSDQVWLDEIRAVD
jgi:HEAT repeat protein